MCGIVGSVNIELNEALVQLLQHRGPDEQALLTESYCGNKIYLGHTRLAIQDLSRAGSQPMRTKDGRYAIVFNGEIYNHLELRKKIFGIDFKGHSDTETILYYLAQNGIAAVKDLNGIFAFSFFDKVKGRIYIARDPFGVKPLYYKNNDNNLIFSSEIRAISALEKSELDYGNLYCFLMLRFNPSPQTLFRDIHKLEPGHYIEYELESNKIVNKVFYSYLPEKNNAITQNEALQEYEDLLVKAVQRQLLSDVPIAVLLSGGVDSALVTKIAQDVSGERLDTYTAGYTIESAANEFVEARETAKILNTRHHEVMLDEGVFYDTLPSLIKAIEEPLGSQSIFPINFLSQQIHQDGYKVALTGQGVDEPWGGYGRYNSEIFFDKVQSPIFSTLRPLQGLFNHDKVKRGIRALTSGTRVDRFVETYSVFNSNMIEQMTVGLSSTIYHNSLQALLQSKFNYLSLNEYRGVDAMTFLDARMNLSDDLLLYTDKVSMQHSLELRVPFLDLDLMRFAESLPAKLKVTLFKNKILHKKLSEKFLPGEIVYRKKKGFYTPRQEWFKGVLGDKYLSLLMDDVGSFSTVINKEYVGRLFKCHKQGAVNYEKQIYLLVVLFYWMRYFVDGQEI